MFQAIKAWFTGDAEQCPTPAPAESVGEVASDNSEGGKLGNVLNLAKDWGSHVYEKVVHSGEEAVHTLTDKSRLNEVGNAVRGVVDRVPIFRDFQRLQDEFTAEQASKHSLQVDSDAATDAVLLPWHAEAAGVTDANLLDKLRSRVLELSKHPNTFLVAPPAEAHVEDEVFRSPDNVHLASALLENDPNLSEMRYKLVPNQIREDLFWRNYFYRLSIVRQSFQLSSMADSGSDEFVCVDQDSSSWYRSTSDSTPPESSTPPEAPTKPRGRKERSGKRQSQVSDKPSVTPQVVTTEVHPNSNTSLPSPTATNVVPTKPVVSASVPLSSGNASEIDELTAEELLEAELASDLSALDPMAPLDDAQLDRELELEILAELDDQTGGDAHT